MQKQDPSSLRRQRPFNPETKTVCSPADYPTKLRYQVTGGSYRIRVVLAGKSRPHAAFSTGDNQIQQYSPRVLPGRRGGNGDWLTEVVRKFGKVGKRLWSIAITRIATQIPELMRLALNLATGRG